MPLPSHAGELPCSGSHASMPGWSVNRRSSYVKVCAVAPRVAHSLSQQTGVRSSQSTKAAS
eukprot:377976-Prymnesium_polylepis.1